MTKAYALTKEEAILRELKENPKQKNDEIAKAVDATPSYVANVRHRFGYGPIQVQFSPANLDWLNAQSKRHKLTLAALIESCVTDARLDDEEMT